MNSPVSPIHNGMSSTASYDPDTALPRNGRWVQRGLIRVWEGPKPPDIKYADEGGDTACTKCNAKLWEPCKNQQGKRIGTEHVDRITPRRCPCGDPITTKTMQCDPCREDDIKERDARARERKRDRARRIREQQHRKSAA